MDSTRLELDGRKRRLLFHGNCLEILSLCAASCCRQWVVGISEEEYKSGLYEAEQVCLLTGKGCDKGLETCINRDYRLQKGSDGACIHLGNDSRCRIYENRPQVCRDFTCEGGWRLESVFPPRDTPLAPGSRLDLHQFLERVRDDMTFVLHPLLILHTVVYLKAKKQIIFVKEMVGRCGKFDTRDAFDFPQLNDDLILGLINGFDKKRALGEIHRDFCERHSVELSKQDFYQVVWLLNRHSIVLESRNLRGMLGGIGGV